MEWRPGGTLVVHGVVQRVAGLPSSRTVAPAGLVMTVTSWGPAGVLCTVSAGRRSTGATSFLGTVAGGLADDGPSALGLASAGAADGVVAVGTVCGCV